MWTRHGRRRSLVVVVVGEVGGDLALASFEIVGLAGEFFQDLKGSRVEGGRLGVGRISPIRTGGDAMEKLTVPGAPGEVPAVATACTVALIPFALRTCSSAARTCSMRPLSAGTLP